MSTDKYAPSLEKIYIIFTNAATLGTLRLHRQFHPSSHQSSDSFATIATI